MLRLQFAKSTSTSSKVAAQQTPKMSRYVPPHLRNRTQASASTSASSSSSTSSSKPNGPTSRRSLSSLSSNPPSRFTSRSNWSNQDVRSVREPASSKDTEKKEEGNAEEEKAKHADLESKETLMIQEFYSTNSKVYESWTKTRGEAHDNEHISRFFEKKKANSKWIRLFLSC